MIPYRSILQIDYDRISTYHVEQADSVLEQVVPRVIWHVIKIILSHAYGDSYASPRFAVETCSFSPDMPVENDVRPRVPPAMSMLVVQILSQSPAVLLVDTACTR